MKDKDPLEILKLLKIDAKVKRLFFNFLNEASIHLSRIHDPEQAAKNLTLHSPVEARQLEELLRKFYKQYKSIVEESAKKAWELSEMETDNDLLKWIKKIGIAVSGAKLLKIFNRETKDPEKVTIENILNQQPKSDAWKAYAKENLRLSERVWKLTRENQKMIKNYLLSGISKGQSAAQISQDLRRFLNNPDTLFRRVRDPETGKLVYSQPMKNYHPGQGVYRSSYKNALRVAREETNRAYRMADMERFKRTDMILGFEVKLSGSHPEYDLCDPLAGKYPKTFTWLGWHVQCFCYVVPVLPDKETFVQYLDTDRIAKKHYITGIPPQANSWVKEKSAKIQTYQSKPDWLQNFTLKDGTYKPKKSIFKPI